MISEIIIDNVIRTTDFEAKDFLLKLFIMKLSNGYSYNDDKVNHCLELMLDNSKLVEIEHIDMKFITENIAKFVYNGDKYIFKDITIKYIDNIDCVICVGYKYIEKINEDRGDVSYMDTYVNISFIDNPKVLKKS